MQRTLFFSLLLIFFTGSAACSWYVKPDAPPDTLEGMPYSEGEHIGSILDPDINEASGMAPSHLQDDLLWIINDSGNPAELFAVDTTGWVLDDFAVENTRNRDWEDLASFSVDNVPYLLIADTGDNRAKRDTCSLLIVREPDLKAKGIKEIKALPVTNTITFRYEDGPRDCESVAVDTVQNRILLLSKRTQPPVLYELPLALKGSGDVLVAKKTAMISTIPLPTEGDLAVRNGKYRSQPTAMDISSDGTHLAVLTYKHAYLYTRSLNPFWSDAVSKEPQCIILPHPDSHVLVQREALCFARETQQIFVTSEFTPAPLYRLDPRVE